MNVAHNRQAPKSSFPDRNRGAGHRALPWRVAAPLRSCLAPHARCPCQAGSRGLFARTTLYSVALGRGQEWVLWVDAAVFVLQSLLLLVLIYKCRHDLVGKFRRVQLRSGAAACTAVIEGLPRSAAAVGPKARDSRRRMHTRPRTRRGLPDGTLVGHIPTCHLLLLLFPFF